MNEHAKFQILCALAVVDQVSDADLRKLKQHIECCVACQNRISDFAQISAQALPLPGERYSKASPPINMTARFIERARAEGIPLRESQRIVPRLSLGPFTWMGNLAAALLLIAILAGGISKSVHPRTQLGGAPVKVAQVELPSRRTAQTAIPHELPAPQHPKVLPTPRRRQISAAGFRESGDTEPRLTSGHDGGSLGLRQVLPDVQYSVDHHQGTVAFDSQSQLFSSDIQVGHSSFQTHDGKASPWLAVPSLMLFAERNQLVKAADQVGADPKENPATFAIVSLNLPLHVLNFGSDRPHLNDSALTQSELNLNIDWRQVRMTMRSESSRNSIDVSKDRPSVTEPVWPFSNGPQGEHQ